VEELNIKKACELCKVSLEDLLGIEGIGKQKAANIKKWF
jgi:DNA repair protein RadC